VHWPDLATRLGGEDTRALRAGEDAARRLGGDLADATASYNLFGSPAAEVVGGSVAQGRGRAADRFLERNQALRLALLDADHLVTLLGYQAALAQRLDQPDLRALLARWEHRIATVERDLRRQVASLAEDPDGAIEPVDRSALGRAAHGAAVVAGSVGEWIDRVAAGPRGR
jgi:hypothetical protein